jgi:hypothetical protein
MLGDQCRETQSDSAGQILMFCETLLMFCETLLMLCETDPDAAWLCKPSSYTKEGRGPAAAQVIMPADGGPVWLRLCVTQCVKAQGGHVSTGR